MLLKVTNYNHYSMQLGFRLNLKNLSARENGTLRGGIDKVNMNKNF